MNLPAALLGAFLTLGSAASAQEKGRCSAPAAPDERILCAIRSWIAERVEQPSPPLSKLLDALGRGKADEALLHAMYQYPVLQPLGPRERYLILELPIEGDGRLPSLDATQVARVLDFHLYIVGVGAPEGSAAALRESRLREAANVGKGRYASAPSGSARDAALREFLALEARRSAGY